MTLPRLSLFLLGASVLGASVLSLPLPSAAAPAPAIQTVPGMPPVVDTQNVYSEAGINKVSAVTAGALARVYVPNVKSGDVYVIDPATYSVVDHFKVGGNPQHIIPSWDLKTLWVAGSAERKLPGILTPIDPKTGKPGTTINVPDAYNLYFMPDGSSAIVVAEALKRLEFRDPQTMKLQSNLATPQCAGLNHADFSIDGRYAIFTCEFAGGGLAKIDMVAKKVVGYLKLTKQGLPGMPAMNMPGANNAAASMPQDIRIAPDGKLFYVADMQADGVYLVDGDSFQEVGFIPTGRGTHGLYPSRDGKKLYVTNRGTHMGDVKAHGPGMISVIDFATRKVEKTWSIPGGGSPDMGNVSADGKTLWLSGRFDKVVYAIDTTSGAVKEIPVGTEPHGLTVWPQPGRYSLGHTGNMR
ncbi:MAG TPA: YncE family protein [Micropepsaceae bacterium]